MSRKSYSQKVVDLSVVIRNKLGIEFDISTFQNVSISFIEAIFKTINPTYDPLGLSHHQRYKLILQWLSDSLELPLDHITADSLVGSDALSLHNLLEILHLCIDSSFEDDELNDPDSHRSENACNSSESASKEDVDAALKESRIKYLQCKLSEMVPFEAVKPLECEIETTPCTKPKNAQGPRVKFAETAHVIPEKSTDLPICSSQSILRSVQRPLRSSSVVSRSVVTPLSTDQQKRFHWSPNVSISKLPNREANFILEEMMTQLEVLNLSKETQNYIRIKLQSYLGHKRSQHRHRRRHHHWRRRSSDASVTDDSDNSSEHVVSARLAEVAERQYRRAELEERQAAEAERVREARDSAAFHRLLRADLRQRHAHSVAQRRSARHLLERTAALEAAQRAHEDQIVRNAFDTALEKARQRRMEENGLKREFQQLELELQNKLADNIEHRQQERARFLRDEREKHQAAVDLRTKANKLDNLREKMAKRRRLVKQIKEMEEALYQQTNP